MQENNVGGSKAADLQPGPYRGFIFESPQGSDCVQRRGWRIMLTNPVELPPKSSAGRDNLLWERNNNRTASTRIPTSTYTGPTLSHGTEHRTNTQSLTNQYWRAVGSPNSAAASRPTLRTTSGRQWTPGAPHTPRRTPGRRRQERRRGRDV